MKNVSREWESFEGGNKRRKSQTKSTAAVVAIDNIYAAAAPTAKWKRKVRKWGFLWGRGGVFWGCLFLHFVYILQLLFYNLDPARRQNSRRPQQQQETMDIKKRKTFMIFKRDTNGKYPVIKSKTQAVTVFISNKFCYSLLTS